MDIRTFTGHTLVEALSQVKQELGEDAVILTSRRAEDPSRLPEGHLVEVVAALPAPMPTRPGRGQNRSGELKTWQPPRLQRPGGAPAEPTTPSTDRDPTASRLVPDTSEPAAVVGTAPAQSGVSDLLEFRGELQDLRRSLRDMRQMARYGSHAAWSDRHDHALRSLCGKGMSRQTACTLLDELSVQPDDARWERTLIAALARRLSCAGAEAPGTPSVGRAVEALVGPTGVGKTTILAKLMLHREGPAHRRAGILSMDTRRVAAIEQIRRLAGILRAPLELVYRPGDLAAAMERLSGCDLVLVDTAGTGPRERLGLERARTFLQELKPRHIHVVVPASMRLEDQLATITPWRQAGADRLIVTKLDEAAGLGGLVDLSEQAGMPFSYAGTGQRIPDDVARLEPSLLAHWILRPESIGREPEARLESSRRIKALVEEARLDA